MALPTRKEIRQSAEAAQAELATLKTPAGMAAFLLTQGEDYRRDVSIEVGRLLDAQETSETEPEPEQDDLAVPVDKPAEAAAPAAGSGAEGSSDPAPQS